MELADPPAGGFSCVPKDFPWFVSPTNLYLLS
jgi:hypothetical protein